MTFREKLKEEHPNCISENFGGGCVGCPKDYGYESGRPAQCDGHENTCTACWNREYTPTMEKHKQLTSEKSLENPTGRSDVTFISQK